MLGPGVDRARPGPQKKMMGGNPPVLSQKMMRNIEINQINRKISPELQDKNAKRCFGTGSEPLNKGRYVKGWLVVSTPLT